MPNLRHWCEPLGGTESLIETMGFKWVLRRRQRKVCDEEQASMPAGSDFHTEVAAMLKPREAKVVQTRGTNNRLVLEERRERAGW